MSKIYTSVNNAIVSIINCEDEPIKFPGSIQPHGFLFAINKDTGIISLCSANTANFLGKSPEYFLSKPFSSVLPQELLTIAGHLRDTNGKNFVTNEVDRKMPYTVIIGELTFDCFKRSAGDYILLECINSVANPFGTYDLIEQTSDLLISTDTETSLFTLCTMVADKIRHIIGFDRVMVYKFDNEYNGCVYAESIAANTDSFLGLHFPHTDIPKQARELYLKNPFRLIPDVDYKPVPMLTMDPTLTRPEILDMADVQIRSVSPIHIIYLKNMGVGASMSISIIKDRKLWGLIACHHNCSKPLTYIRQFQAYMLARILSSQIAAFEAKEQNISARELDVPLREVMEYLKRQENFIELHFQKLAAVTKIVNATGAVLIYNNNIYVNGIVPPPAFIMSLKNWLDNKGEVKFTTDQLSKVYPPALDFIGIASGLLYKQLDIESNNALLWFRPSSDSVIEWAGNPKTEDTISPLTPRNSFASWKETVKGTSAAWNQPEQDTAFRFSYLLQQHILNLLKYENDLKNRRLNEQLLKANKELENINWISTHDLKEPLRKIQVFASMIDGTRTVPNVDAINRSIEKIKFAAVKMQQFIDDLFLYSKMSGIEMKYEPVDLSDVITTVIEDFTEERDNNIFHLQCSSMPVIRASRFQMHQLFVNIIDNSIKFRKDKQKQLIDISCELVTNPAENNTGTVNWHKISISDHGIGFSGDVSASIFDIFKKGHSDSSLKGTGVGLSVCKKIMENHGGTISASGVEDEGAIITLQFPA